MPDCGYLFLNSSSAEEKQKFQNEYPSQDILPGTSKLGKAKDGSSIPRMNFVPYMTVMQLKTGKRIMSRIASFDRPTFSAVSNMMSRYV